jgi:sugar phosphate isomerase/epimerase
MAIDRRRFLRDSSMLLSAGALGAGLLGCGDKAAAPASPEPAADTGATMSPSGHPDLLASYWTISGNTVPAIGPEYSSFDFRDRAETISRIGFKGMGIWHADLYKTLETRSLAEMRSILDDNGIEYLELEFLFDWFLDGDKKAQSDIEKAKLLHAAEILGARHLKVGDFWNTPATIEKCAESFAALCHDAADVGINILFEVMPFAMIDNLRDAVTMLDMADTPNGGLMIDTWHIVKMGVSNEELGRVPRRHILGVELNDGYLETPAGMDMNTETTEHRQFCGEGEFDLPGMLAAIGATGYDGPYGVEVINKSNRVLPLDEVAYKAWDTTIAQFG